MTREYRDLYVQSDTSLLADVFEDFRDKCKEKYELHPAHFLSASGLAWKGCLKKTNVELELLTDNDMLLMFEEELEWECAKQHIDMLKHIINT